MSYRQLTAAGQQVFRQLGVFAAPADMALARAVIAPPPETDLEDVIHLLARHNLVMYDEKRERLRLHDLVRDLARQQMDTAGETEETSWRYARAALQIAWILNAQYEAGGDGVLAALAQFDIERPHIDEAYRWASGQRGAPEGDRLLLDAATATASIGDLRYDARRERLPQWVHAVEAARRLGDISGEAAAWKNVGNAYRVLGDLAQAIDAYEASANAARTIGDRHAEGSALGNLGSAYAESGDARRAISSFTQSLTIMQALGDRRREGMCLGNLGNAYLMLGDARRAIPACEQAVEIARELGDRRGEGITLNNLGLAWMYVGDIQQAMPSFEQRLAIARELGDRRGEGVVLGNLGNAWVELGEAAHAVDVSEQAIAIGKAIGDRRGQSYALLSLARAQALLREYTRARATFEQALALLQEIPDRQGESECRWYYSVFLLQRGERDTGLDLLRAVLAHEQEVGHARAAEHAALFARLEAGESLPPELALPGGDDMLALGEDRS